MHIEGIHESNRVAWDITAGNYEGDVDADIEFLRRGGSSLLEPERRILGDLSAWCERAIHLQCSHGMDALSLLHLGAREVVGVDISERMLALARRKSEALRAPAQWVHSDVLSAPAKLDGTADLVYTGKGALPWVMDIEAWASVVSRLLRPGGILFVFEGHPLDWVWDPEDSGFRLRADGSGYFSENPRANDTFPAGYIARTSPSELNRPIERQWTLGKVMNALTAAGLTLQHFEEHPDQYWPLFTKIEEKEVRRLPHTYSLIMKSQANSEET